MGLRSALFRLFNHVSRRRRWQLVGLLALMLVGAVAEMATLGAVVPFLALLADPSVASKYKVLKDIITWTGGTPDNLIFGAAVMFGCIAISAGLIRMLLTWASLRISHGLGADIGGEVYRRTLYQPYSWHVSHNSSEILAGIDKVNPVVYGVITQLLQGSVAVVMTLGILVMLLSIDTQTALVAGLGFSVTYGIITVVVRKQLARNSKIIAESVTHRVQAAQEGLGGIRDVLLDGTQGIYHQRFSIFDYAIRRSQAANELVAAAPRYVIEATGMVLIAALAYWLAAREGGLAGSIPILGALAIGAQKLLPQMQLAYSSWTSVSGTRAQLADVLDLLDRPIGLEYLQQRSPATSSTARHLHNVPLIALRNVSFSYKPGTQEVLRDINLHIHRGARIGFIGRTGSGKSTLIDIVMGLLEPTGGSVEIDGEDLDSNSRRAWQQRIAHVPQSIFLSDASIAENIAFGVPKKEIDPARIKLAATRAQLADFIAALPHQYETTVGERGVRLSGGQRQRIGLARALYKHCVVLVLDEATSALDDATEKKVMSSIRALGSDLTVLMIAHRVTTLRDCDQVVELENASVLRIGSYTSVVESAQSPLHDQDHMIPRESTH